MSAVAVPTTAAPTTAAPSYILHLADNALVLGQRNAEWCGHGPVLEEDIAMANISLDLVGQARMLYQHAASVMNAQSRPCEKSANRAANETADQSAPLTEDPLTEDRLAYFRHAPEFLNYVLLELPHRTAFAPSVHADKDYAVTIVRNALYAQLMLPFWDALQGSADAQLAAIAAKSVKETRYHVRHSRDWLVRFGDGTDESHARAQAALDYLMPYTQEFWTGSAMETEAVSPGIVAEMTSFRPQWDADLDAVLAQATLQRPSPGGFVTSGKTGTHSEHLSYLLAEMQSLARAHPDATW
jgi:ring-1,2-phenylacetyl-CoA epoxidase subunit PaaC